MEYSLLSIPDSRKRDDEFSPHLAEPPEFLLTNENIGNGNTGWCLYKLGATAFGSVWAYN